MDYLIAQCDPQQTTSSYYTGIGNVTDLQAPAVMVSVDNGVEVYHGSNVYDMTVTIAIKEMAADMVSGSLGRLTSNIFNAICNPGIKDAINLNNRRSFSTLFVQRLDTKHSTDQDALISDITIRVIGCLSGSL